jgi:hypothetical protein
MGFTMELSDSVMEGSLCDKFTRVGIEESVTFHSDEGFFAHSF